MSSPTLDRPSRWRPSRVVIDVVVVAMLAMWGYVLYLAFGPGRQPPPDRLDDPTFAIAAQARCDAALDEVAALPSASRVRDARPSEPTWSRRPTTVFAAMLDDLAEPRARRRGRRARRGSGWPTGAPTSATATDYADASGRTRRRSSS